MQNPPTCLATQTMYFAPSPKAHSAHWSVSNGVGFIAERGVERSSPSKSCQVLGAKCTNMPISRSCHAVSSGVGTASLRSGPAVESVGAYVGFCQRGRAALAAMMELIKFRRFMMEELLKQLVSHQGAI